MIRNRRCSLALAILVGTTAAISAATAAETFDPSGQWLVADRSAVMKIELCADGYYASIDWERVPGTDAKNPDPKKRGRPLVGIAILTGMKQTGTNEWEGRVYNPKDGKTYDAQMSQPRPDTIKLEGCVLGGLICDGETWTRVLPATTGAAPLPALADKPKSYCPVK